MRKLQVLPRASYVEVLIAKACRINAPRAKCQDLCHSWGPCVSTLLWNASKVYEPGKLPKMIAKESGAGDPNLHIRTGG